MRSTRAPSAPTGGAGSSGGVVQVPAAPGGSGPTASDAAALSQAERATRALAEGRREREVTLERAFLEAALDFRQTLRVLVSAFVPRLADWCFIDLVDGDGIPRRVEVAHADPARADLAREMRAVAFGAAGWATPAAQTIRDGTPRLFPELSRELMEWATDGEQHLSVLRAMRPNSLLAVPLVARDRTIGAVTLIRSAMVPPLSEDDLVAAAEVAGPAALALDNARCYQAERAARSSAEEQADVERHARLEAERSVLRLRRLEALSASLASVLSPGAIARVAVENGLSALEPATAVVVRATSGGALEVLHEQGWPDDLALELRVLPADAPALVAEAHRIQTAIWVPTAAALVEGHPNAAALAERLGERAVAAVPLRADGATLGALAVGFPHPRELDGDEKRFLLAVAQLVAQALARAHLRDEAGN